MYEAHFGLRERPFALAPDTSFLFPTRQHEMGLNLLEYAVTNDAGFTLLTGEVGCGKTLLVRELLRRLGDEVTVGLVSNTHPSLGRLMKWICIAYGIDHRGRDEAELYEAFVEFLIAQYGAGRRVLLVVDEAQNLDTATLEELRVLSNVNGDKHLVLQTMLVGQPELRERLRSPELRQLAQRIGVDHHLGALARDDARHYVRHRLSIAGGRPDLIETGAVDLAFAASAGIPRLLNQLCDTALVFGFSDQRHAVDADLMSEVILHRAAGGLLANATRQGSPSPAT
jgi:general secretion pathway protein A